MKILIFGASGSGTTPLGEAIGQGINFKHLDVDTYYWKKLNRRFNIKYL